MDVFKKVFVNTLYENGAVLSGEHTLKGGDRSDIFIDIGKLLGDPRTTDRLAYFYAIAIRDKVKFDNFDVIVGLPGKGVPIAQAVSDKLAKDFGVEKKVTYQRESPKYHGEAPEKGWETMYYGHKPERLERLLFLDDVYTKGTTLKKSLETLQEYSQYLEFPDIHERCVALFVSVDRGKGKGPLPVVSVVDLGDIKKYKEINT